MPAYFSFFPTIRYGQQIITNILAKVRFDASVNKNLAQFYPYEIKEGERPDQIAQWFYGDSYYDWLIYLANNTKDPYFEWPLTQTQFRDNIIAKYGSEANAQLQVAFWSNNYYGDDSILDPSAYSALADSQKFFWTPIIGADGETIAYERKTVDLTVDTNQTLALTGTFSDTPENTYVTQASASGFVAHANTSSVTLRHVQGTFAAGACSVGVVTAATVIATSMTPENAVYFSPTSYYEYEEDINEGRKNIRLLQSQYVDAVVRDMQSMLSV